MDASTQGVFLERLAGLDHFFWALENDHLAVVADPHVDKGFDDLETASPGRELLVRRDLGAPKCERHAAIGQVDTGRLFCIPFIGAIAETHEASDRLIRIEEVEIHALVEIRLGAERVREVILRDDVPDDLGHVLLLIDCLHAC